jgi:hypothetical protein
MTTTTTTKTRYAIAMTVVMSAALCADRVAVAAPQARAQQPASVASRVMDRLSLSLRRVVPSIRVIETRREGTTLEPTVSAPEAVRVARQPITPFQFRLPPPTV